MDTFLTFFLFIVGVYVIYMSLRKNTLVCPKTVEYRYIPRTLQEEQKDPVKVSDIFKSMFENREPVAYGSGTVFTSTVKKI